MSDERHISLQYRHEPWMWYRWHPEEYEKWDKMPDVLEYLHLHSSSGYIFGVDRSFVPWGHSDRLMFEFVIVRHAFDSVLEFGTWSGVSSLYFGMAAAMRRIPFVTFDICDIRPYEVKKVWLWNMSFIRADLLKGVDDHVACRVMQPDMLLIVDNGDKTKEAAMYGKYMAKGSVMIVHDWGIQVPEEPISTTLREDGFVPLYFDFAEHLKSTCRVWQRQKVQWE